MLERLDADWDARWPGTTPVGHLLRDVHRDRWVRFHALPEDKRHPETEEEYAVVLARHRALLDHLGLAGRCFVVGGDELPGFVPWRTVPADAYGEDESFAVLATEMHHPSEALDTWLRAVADDQTMGEIIVPPGAKWLYHPYDGGMDVILGSAREREALRASFPAWLSPWRPVGRYTVVVHPMGSSDEPFLREMVRLAAGWRGDPPASLTPELERYVAGFGRPGDHGVAGLQAGRDLGAAWYRLLDDGYGHVAPDVPELAIAVVEPARGHGLGSELLTQLIWDAEAQGHPGLSLSVEPDNPARRLYERHDFEKVAESGSAWTMLRRTGQARSPTRK